MHDDLTLLRELRADAPEPGPDRLRSLRARVLEQGDPAPPGHAPRRRTPERSSRPSDGTGVRGLRGGTGGRRLWGGTGARRLWFGPSVLVLAAGAAAAIVAVTGTNGTVPRTGTATTAEHMTPMSAPRAVLLEAALMAERRDAGGTPRDDQWLYRKVAVKQPSDTVPTIQESWTRYDGKEQAFRQNQGPMERHTIEIDPDDDDLTPKEYAAKLAALPTDPGKLLAHVKKDRHWRAGTKEDPGTGEHPDARAFRVLSVYLDQDADVPPRLEAAIFRALAELPGIRVQPGVRDATGRTGIGLSYEPQTRLDARGQVISRSFVVLDQSTFQFLGRRVATLQDEVLGHGVVERAGTFYASAELASGVVDAPGVIP